MDLDYTNANFLLAFAGGVITFFASCFLPLIPTYIAYLSGLKTEDSTSRSKIFINSVIFTLGFITIFILFGFSAAKVGNHFSEFRDLGQRIGGLVMILFGLFLLDVLKPKVLIKEFKLKVKVNPTKFMLVNSFLLGLSFGFAWTPCIGPLLGVIIFYASQAKTVIKGTILLLSYGIGLGVPFILIAVLFDRIWPKIRFLIKYSELINKISGVLVLLAGVTLLIGKMNTISLYVVKLLNLHFQTF